MSTFCASSLADLKEQLSSLVSAIESTTSARHVGQKSSLFGSVWRNFADLNSVLTTLKTSLDDCGKEATKLALFVTSNVDPSELPPLVGEIKLKLDSLKAFYDQFVVVPSSRPLFFIYNVNLRTALKNFVHLIDLLNNGSSNEKAMKAVSGATKLFHDAITNLQELPVTNRAAYRRDIMSKMKIVKETIDEFQSHVNIYHQKQQNGTTQMTQQEEGSDSEGEEEGYTDEEVVVAESAIALMTHCYKVCGVTVMAVTQICDRYTPSGSMGADSSPVPEPPLHSSDTNTEINANSLQMWSASVCLKLEALSELVINLGANLYDPFEDIEESKSSYTALREGIQVCTDVLFTVVDPCRNMLSQKLLDQIDEVNGSTRVAWFETESALVSAVENMNIEN
jgi:hypothetical protein